MKSSIASLLVPCPLLPTLTALVSLPEEVLNGPSIFYQSIEIKIKVR